MIQVLATLPHQVPWCEAMAEGLRRHGETVDTVATVGEVRGTAVCWGWRHGREILERGHDVLVLERGFVGDRLRTWSAAGWNGLNGRARFPGALDGGERWEGHFAGLLAPWRAEGPGVALLIGQVPGDQALDGRDHVRWCAETTIALAELGHEVRHRPHPMAADPGRTLAEDLASARLVVTWNSNAGVDAVLAGVPTVTMDRGAMAWDVAAHDLASGPRRTDRTAWAHALAWCQWTLAEMRDGSAWEALKTCRS